MIKLKNLMICCVIVFLTLSHATALAASVAEIQQQQQEVKAQLNSNSDKLSQLTTKINTIYQQLSSLQAKKDETTAKIATTTKQLEFAQQQHAKRVKDAKERLRELQLRQGTNATLTILEKAKNLTQWLSNMIALQRLQSVYNDSMAAVKESIATISNTKNQLQSYEADLQQQTKDLQTQQNELTTQVNELKNVIATNQSKLKDLANQEQQAKAIEEAQAKQAQQAAQQNQATINQTANVDVNGPGQVLTMQATGYSTAELGASVYSATGINLRQNPSCVAVDPSVIPLGSVIWVSGYGVSIAGDTGGAIKGNIIDLHFSTVAQAINWGRRTVTVKILS